MEVKVVPVVVINDINDTIPTLQAMCDGNLPVAEITFRTACAEEAIRLGTKTFPDMYIDLQAVPQALSILSQRKANLPSSAKSPISIS